MLNILIKPKIIAYIRRQATTRHILAYLEDQSVRKIRSGNYSDPQR